MWTRCIVLSLVHVEVFSLKEYMFTPIHGSLKVKFCAAKTLKTLDLQVETEVSSILDQTCPVFDRDRIALKTSLQGQLDVLWLALLLGFKLLLLSFCL